MNKKNLYKESFLSKTPKIHDLQFLLYPMSFPKESHTISNSPYACFLESLSQKRVHLHLIFQKKSLMP